MVDDQQLVRFVSRSFANAADDTPQQIVSVTRRNDDRDERTRLRDGVANASLARCRIELRTGAAIPLQGISEPVQPLRRESCIRAGPGLTPMLKDEWQVGDRREAHPFEQLDAELSMQAADEEC